VPDYNDFFIFKEAGGILTKMIFSQGTMKKANGTICFTSILLLFFMQANLFAAEPITINTGTDGIAAIVGGNTALARDAAITDALKNAVEQAVGTIVSAEKIAPNHQLLDDKIYTRTEAYVRNYRITSEKSIGNLYQVTIRADVSTEKLKNDLSALGLLLSPKQMPKVMMMIAQKNIEQDLYSFWWGGSADQADIPIAEASIIERLAARGFNVIDHSAKAQTTEIPDPLKTANLTNASIKKIGSLYGADVVIYGKALAMPAEPETEEAMQSAEAEISLHAVDTDSGEVIAAARNRVGSLNINPVTAGSESLEKAVGGISEDFFSQIIQKRSKEIIQQTTVQMVISNIKSYGRFVKFKNTLQTSIPGVQAVHQRGFSRGAAVLDIEMKGSAQSLADELTMAHYDSYTVDITGLTQNSIKVEMRSIK